MKAVSKILAGGIGLAALAGAAPAAAQYYPGYPGGGYGGSSGLGAIIETLLGGNRYAYGVDQRTLVNQCIAAVTDRIQRSTGYGYNPYGGGYGGYGGGYGGNHGGGYGAGANARVLGITSIEPRRDGVRVRGTATAIGGATAAPYGGQYGNPYGGQQYGNPYGGGQPANPYGQYGNIYGYGGGQYGGGQYGGSQYGGQYGGAYAQPAGELTFKCNIDQRGRITDIDLDRNNYAYGNPYRRY